MVRKKGSEEEKAGDMPQIRISADMKRRLDHYLVDHPELSQWRVVSEAVADYLKKKGA